MAKTKVFQKNANRRRSVTKVKSQVKTLRGAPKETSFVLFLFVSLSDANRLKIKVFLEVSLVSLTLRAHTVFNIFLKKCRQFRCTDLLYSIKLVHLHDKH